MKTTPTHDDIKRQLSDAYAQGLAQGKRIEREWCALLVEQLGIEGYGTLAIAAAIRERNMLHANQNMREM